MCSVDGDGITEMIKTEVKILSESDICRKCKTNKAEIVLREKDFYCNQCFLVYFVHKFRSTIGKSREIKHEDKILMVYSGDLSSTSLLQLIHSGLHENSNKRLRIDPCVLFINESGLNPESISVEPIYEKVSNLEFPFYCINFEEVMKPGNKELLILTSETVKSMIKERKAFPKDINLLYELRRLSLKLKSKTSQIDFICQLRQELISRCANQMGFKKVFLADNGTELAIKILSDIALGRGSQLSDHVHFKAKHFNIEVFRPMREIFEEELKLFAQCENLSVPQKELTDDNEKANIPSCTRKFVLGLQKEFLSTVPTIFKTGGKLVSGNINVAESLSSNISDSLGGEYSQRSDNTETCIFCGFSKDQDSNCSLSAYEAVKVSKVLSTTLPPRTSSQNGIKEDEEASLTFTSEKQDLSEEEISQYFCYGCGNMCREMKSLEDYPPRIREKLGEVKHHKHTLKLIEDFIL